MLFKPKVLVTWTNGDTTVFSKAYNFQCICGGRIMELTNENGDIIAILSDSQIRSVEIV